MARFFQFQIHRLCLIFSLLFLTVGCDQVTKVVARDVLPTTGSLQYLHQSVVLVHAENPGAFLNLGAHLQQQLRFWIFTVVIGILLIAALIFLVRRSSMGRWTTIAITLFVAGGLGNFIDRVDRGTVTDFINLGIGPLRTGIFNFADVAIVLGFLVLMVKAVQERSRSA